MTGDTLTSIHRVEADGVNIFYRAGGKNDPFFIPAGAGAYRTDLPDAKIQFLDTGHFATEKNVADIAFAMRDFLEANGIGGRAKKKASQ